MAEDKKSFILYADLIHTVKKLPKDKAGELFMTILSYVNDENPTIEDVLIDIVFEPIKRQMKRDLLKYESKKEQYSRAGKAAAEAKKALREQNERQRSLTTVNEGSTFSTVTVNVNDNVTVNDTVNVTVTDTPIEPWACDDLEIEYDILTFFKFNEVANFDKLKIISDFTYALKSKNRLDYFKDQFKFYKQFKELSGERIHNFMSFLGNQNTGFDDGKWDDANWEQKFIDEQKKLNDGKKDKSNFAVIADIKRTDGRKPFDRL